MKELPKKIHDDRNDLDYTLHGDYDLPDLDIAPDDSLGKYGRAQLRYLKEHQINLYTVCCFVAT